MCKWRTQTFSFKYLRQYVCSSTLLYPHVTYMRVSTQVLLCLFSGVLWLWHFLYSVGPHPVSGLHIYTSVVSRAFKAGAASQTGDAYSSRAPGPTSGLQGSENVNRGALLLVPQWRCISSFVFYITRLTECYYALLSHSIYVNGTSHTIPHFPPHINVQYTSGADPGFGVRGGENLARGLGTA